MKKFYSLLLILTAFRLTASPLDDADTAFYTENWQRVIDITAAEERTAAQQSFLAACRIRRCAAALALASEGKESVMPDENGESVSYSPKAVLALYESLYPVLEETGSARVDFWNYSAACRFYAAKYYSENAGKSRVAELLAEADNALRRSAMMSAHNKQLWYFASIVYGDSEFHSEFHNLSFAVSFMRRYLMISGQEADVLGLNRLSVLLRKRNLTLEEKRTALVEINKNLRTLSDPYKKYRYVEGYMPTTCWYNYASNHVFKNVSDATEADLIDVYLKRKINPSTEIGNYISTRLNPPQKEKTAAAAAGQNPEPAETADSSEAAGTDKEENLSVRPDAADENGSGEALAD